MSRRSSSTSALKLMKQTFADTIDSTEIRRRLRELQKKREARERPRAVGMFTRGQKEKAMVLDIDVRLERVSKVGITKARRMLQEKEIKTSAPTLQINLETLHTARLESDKFITQNSAFENEMKEKIKEMDIIKRASPMSTERSRGWTPVSAQRPMHSSNSTRRSSKRSTPLLTGRTRRMSVDASPHHIRGSPLFTNRRGLLKYSECADDPRQFSLSTKASSLNPQESTRLKEMVYEKRERLWNLARERSAHKYRRRTQKGILSGEANEMRQEIETRLDFEKKFQRNLPEYIRDLKEELIMERNSIYHTTRDSTTTMQGMTSALINGLSVHFQTPKKDEAHTSRNFEDHLRTVVTKPHRSQTVQKGKEELRLLRQKSGSSETLTQFSRDFAPSTAREIEEDDDHDSSEIPYGSTNVSQRTNLKIVPTLKFRSGFSESVRRHDRRVHI